MEWLTLLRIRVIFLKKVTVPLNIYDSVFYSAQAWRHKGQKERSEMLALEASNSSNIELPLYPKKKTTNKVVLLRARRYRPNFPKAIRAIY